MGVLRGWGGETTEVSSFRHSADDRSDDEDGAGKTDCLEIVAVDDQEEPHMIRPSSPPPPVRTYQGWNGISTRQDDCDGNDLLARSTRSSMSRADKIAALPEIRRSRTSLLGKGKPKRSQKAIKDAIAQGKAMGHTDTMDALVNTETAAEREQHLKAQQAADKAQQEAFARDAGEDTGEQLQQFNKDSTSSIIDHPNFSIAVAVAVFINMITVGLETELGGNWPKTFAGINSLLLLFYILELCLRLLSQGSEALKDIQTSVDMLTVTVCFAERVMSATESRTRGLIALRMARTLAVARKLDVFAYSKELRILFDNGRQLMKTTFWMISWLLFVCYCFAVVATNCIGNSGEFAESLDPTVEFESIFDPFDNHEYFGSIPRSLLTCLQITSLKQWGSQIARPVILRYPTVFLFFFFFVMITSYGLVMTVVSAMVQNSLEAGQQIDAAKRQIQKENDSYLGKKVMRLIELVDEDKDGELSAEEMNKAYKNYPEFKELLNELGVPVADGDQLVAMLDGSGDGLVSYEEFQVGISCMDDEIRPRDFTKVALRSWSALNKVDYLGFKAWALEKEVKIVCELLQDSFESMKEWTVARDDRELWAFARASVRENGSKPPKPPTLSHKSAKAFDVDEPDVPPEILAKSWIDFTEQNCGSFLSRAPTRTLARRQALRDAANKVKAAALNDTGRGPELLPSYAPTEYEMKQEFQRAERENRDKYKYEHPIERSPAVAIAWVRNSALGAVGPEAIQPSTEVKRKLPSTEVKRKR